MTSTPSTAAAASGVHDVAKRLGISPNSVRRLVASGELRGVKIGRRVVVHAASVDALLERGTAAPSCAVAA